MRRLSVSWAVLAGFASLAARAEATVPAATASPSVSASPAASATPAAKRGDPNTTLVSGSQDVVVKSARYYDTADDNVNSSAQTILVATFVWTNDSGLDLTPRIDHFEFVQPSTEISRGIDSGYTSLVGISNYAGVVKKGESHAYTVGFIVPEGVTGQIIYDLSI